VTKREKALKLSKYLGYQFKSIKLLETALTHKSVSAKNNERLEFLGDSIINFLMAKTIYQAKATAKEGEMSRLRASLVKGETLAEIAKELNLSEFLVLGTGELKSGGHHRKSILADTLEAIIAAIYLDSHIVTCEQIVMPWFASRLDNLSQYQLKDPKSALQEYLQSKAMALPTYEVTCIEGDPHKQIFTVMCCVNEMKKQTEGHANSRRYAEQMAAKAMLELLKTDKGNKQ
tara:strand:+ start:246 stop:941 length:696 start_codon:yes stop_codon:yes gene_type:complete